MHQLNAVLIIAMALVLVAPSSALAYKKKGAAPAKNDGPTESIGLNFSKVQHKYTQQPTKPTSDVGGIKSNARR
jgi:type VI protein secretion system component Hcp